MTDVDRVHVFSPTTAIDVLCGTGQQERQHSGNVLFNRVVLQFAEEYNQAYSKSDKMKISKNIRDLLTQAGVRFLKKCPIYQNWYVGDPRVGRDKIGHFLRLQRGGTGGSTERLLGSSSIIGSVPSSNLPRQRAALLHAAILMPDNPIFPSVFTVPAPAHQEATASAETADKSLPGALNQALSLVTIIQPRSSFTLMGNGSQERQGYARVASDNEDEEEDSTSLIIKKAPPLLLKEKEGSFKRPRCLPMCCCKNNQDLSDITSWRMSVFSSPLTVNEREGHTAPSESKNSSFYITNKEKATTSCYNKMNDGGDHRRVLNVAL